MRLSRILAFVCLFASVSCFAQTTTSITGTIRDNSGALVTSGQVAFTLQPGVDTVASGIARFSSTEVDCTINGSGLVKALDGVSICTLVQNTSIQPSNTSYKACIQPSFVTPGSCFVMYATGSTLDITTVPATPSLTPAYNLVDTFSTQSIGGTKTFTGNVTFGGTLSLGAITLGGTLNMGGNAITNATTINATTVTATTITPTVIVGPAATAVTMRGGPGASADLLVNNAANTANLFDVQDSTGNVELLKAGAQIKLPGATSGNTLLQALATASGTVTLPAATDTLVGKATTDTLTNKTVGAGGLAGLTTSKQVFSATGTFTIPTGVTSAKVTVLGGGGGGGGSTATVIGGGGASGSMAIKWLTGLTPGNTIAVTINSGGGGGVNNAAGATGGSVNIASGTQTITTITAAGGLGGASGTSLQAGGIPGAVATNGDINSAGNPGMWATVSTTFPGNGGSSPFGGGGSGNNGAAGASQAGSGFGSGGSGANGGANGTGGAGTNGMVLFEWTN